MFGEVHSVTLTLQISQSLLGSFQSYPGSAVGMGSPDDELEDSLNPEARGTHEEVCSIVLILQNRLKLT